MAAKASYVIANQMDFKSEIENRAVLTVKDFGEFGKVSSKFTAIQAIGKTNQSRSLNT